MIGPPTTASRRTGAALALRLGLRLALALAALVFALAASACAGDPPPPADVAPRAPLPVEEGVLRAAGSGALTPLVRALGAAFATQPGAVPIVLEPSIGSGGGVRATVDGAVDLGLISRPLSAVEATRGLLAFPLGLDTVVVAGHPELTVDDLSAALLRDLTSGARRTFDDGTPAALLLRDRGESANLAIDAAVPGLAAARDLAYRQPWRRIYYRDDALLAALVVTPGSLGFTSLALLQASHLPHKLLRLDGALPTTQATRDGTWKAVRPIAFVVRPDRLARVRAFLDFAASPVGRRILVEQGYCPPAPASTVPPAAPAPAAPRGAGPASPVVPSP